MTSKNVGINASIYCRSFRLMDATGFDWGDRICRSLGVMDNAGAEPLTLYYDPERQGVYTKVVSEGKLLVRLLAPNGKISRSSYFPEVIDDISNACIAGTFIAGAFGLNQIDPGTCTYPDIAQALLNLYPICKQNDWRCLQSDAAQRLKLAITTEVSRSEVRGEKQKLPVKESTMGKKPKGYSVSSYEPPPPPPKPEAPPVEVRVNSAGQVQK